MNKHFHNLLLGVSVLPALAIMPAMAAAPNTTEPAFVFGDVTATAGSPIEYLAVGGRRMNPWVAGKYRNDFPNYIMIGRSLEIPGDIDDTGTLASTLYVGPVNLTLRELTENDVFRYNYQAPVTYDTETGEYVAVADDDTDVNLADWAGVVWNDANVESKVAGKIGAGNAGYTAPGVEMFSRRTDLDPDVETKAAGSLSIAKTNATVDGATVYANSISVTQGSTLTVANKAVNLLNSASSFYSDAQYIDSDGVTTLNAPTITFDGSTITLEHVVVRDPENSSLIVGVRDAALVINSETPTGITTIQNIASDYGALTVNGGGSLELGGGELNFVDNTSTSHGAGLYYKDQSYGSGTEHGTNTAVLNATDITFSGNEVLSNATSGSGAGIFLSGGKMSILGATNTFTDNHMNATAIANNRLYKTGGGAIANQAYDLESGQFGTVGSAIDADMIIGKADGSSVNIFTDNTSTTNGGAIMNRAEKTDGNATLTINGTTTFDNNSADINGGAIYNLARNDKVATVYMNNGTYTFTENTADELGGAIYNEGTMTLANATFGDVTDATKGNSAIEGGAIYNKGALIFDNATIFGNNSASNDSGDAFGGAIKNYYGDLTFNGAATFTNNSVTSTEGAAQGGALYNLSATTTFNNGSTFSGNTTSSNGAAIYNGLNYQRAGIVNLNGDSLFENNTATGDNGIVFNVSNADVDNTIAFANGDATFRGNTGITLWNQDLVTFTNMGDVLFENNTNTAKSTSNSVISNGGTMTINAENFVVQNNTSGKGAVGNTSSGSVFNLTATNVDFTNNTGGAIYKENDSFTITATDTISFVDNTANKAAAINNNGNYSQTTLNASEIEFSGNIDSGSYAGAIFNSGDYVKLLADKITFSGNEANATTTVAGDMVKYGGGAINNRGNKSSHQVTEIVVGKDANSIVLFENNTSAMHGGAIHARAEAAATETTAADAGKVTINGTTTFSGNIAALNGGAISNSPVLGTSIFTINGNSTFTSNNAGELGGGVYNSGELTFNGTAAFTSNTAGVNGGAIYNVGTLTFNDDSTFIGNKANDEANDIYNLGTLNIASGTTTIDGGINGTGALTIANGATLNIGTASVTQNTITLNGNMIATLRSGDDAQITATAENGFTGNGVLKLLLSNPGEYNVFGGSLFANYEWDESGITTESSVYDLNWTNNGKTVVASLKSVEDIADENDLEGDVATAVAGLNQSTSEKLNDLGVVVQEKLAEGTSEAKQEVEHIAKAIHPETESVVQSVATSIQHTVANLTSARMAAPMFGRNGGDVNFSSRGVWAQGLYNKSKKNDAFDGSTRGIAAGIDGTVDKTLMLGVGYSYADSDINGTARDTDIKSNTVFVYGQYKPAQWYVNAMANYTWSEYSEEDSLVTADYDVDSFGGVIATGYDFASGITPELGLRYIHINGETYTNSIDVKSELKSGDYLTAVLGTKYGFNITSKNGMLFRPELRYAVKYDFVSDKTLATVTMPGVSSYTLDGDRLSRIGGEFGIGLRIGYNGLDVSLNYDIEVREDYTSQTGMLKLRYDF